MVGRDEARFEVVPERMRAGSRTEDRCLSCTTFGKRRSDSSADDRQREDEDRSHPQFRSDKHVWLGPESTYDRMKA